MWLLSDQRRLWDTFLTRETVEKKTVNHFLCNRFFFPLVQLWFHHFKPCPWVGWSCPGQQQLEGKAEEESSLVINKHLRKPCCENKHCLWGVMKGR